VEILDGDHVPRVTGHGARQEAGFVVDEAGNDHFHKFLGEFGDGGWACGGRLLHISTERPSDYGFGSVPDSVNEEFAHCYNVNMM